MAPAMDSQGNVGKVCKVDYYVGRPENGQWLVRRLGENLRNIAKDNLGKEL